MVYSLVSAGQDDESGIYYTNDNLFTHTIDGIIK